MNWLELLGDTLGNQLLKLKTNHYVKIGLHKKATGKLLATLDCHLFIAESLRITLRLYTYAYHRQIILFFTFMYCWKTKHLKNLIWNGSGMHCTSSFFFSWKCFFFTHFWKNQMDLPNYLWLWKKNLPNTPNPFRSGNIFYFWKTNYLLEWKPYVFWCNCNIYGI